MIQWSHTLLVCLLLVGGCTLGSTPEPEHLSPPPEDLSTWSTPELVQPEEHELPALKLKPRQATAAETVYDYVPGGVYKLTVALDAPLDVILEPGEKVQTLLGTDPKPIAQGQAPAQEGPQQPQIKQRWDYKEGAHGAGDKASAHIMLRAMEAGATLGLTVTTNKRVY